MTSDDGGDGPFSWVYPFHIENNSHHIEKKEDVYTFTEDNPPQMSPPHPDTILPEPPNTDQDLPPLPTFADNPPLPTPLPWDEDPPLPTLTTPTSLDTPLHEPGWVFRPRTHKEKPPKPAKVARRFLPDKDQLPSHLTKSQVLQVHHYLQTTDHAYIDLCHCLIWTTGMRTTEVCGLRIRAIDFDRCTIMARWQKHKGAEAVRPLPLRPPLVTLDDGTQGPDPLLIYDRLKALCTRRDKNDYVFYTQQETPLNRKILHKHLKAAYEACGIELRTMGGHAGRHACLTFCAEQGVDVLKIQGLAGHANLATTSRYLHATDAEKKWVNTIPF